MKFDIDYDDYFIVNLSLDMDFFNKMMVVLGGNTIGFSFIVSFIF